MYKIKQCVAMMVLPIDQKQQMTMLVALKSHHYSLVRTLEEFCAIYSLSSLSEANTTIKMTILEQYQSNTVEDVVLCFAYGKAQFPFFFLQKMFIHSQFPTISKQLSPPNDQDEFLHQEVSLLTAQSQYSNQSYSMYLLLSLFYKQDTCIISQEVFHQ